MFVLMTKHLKFDSLLQEVYVKSRKDFDIFEEQKFVSSQWLRKHETASTTRKKFHFFNLPVDEYLITEFKQLWTLWVLVFYN